MHTEPNGPASPLDARIADVLADPSPAATDLAKIIREAMLAVDAADIAAEAEHTRSLDPENPTPEKSIAMLRKVELARDRLNAALPRLRSHYSEAGVREHASAWCKDYDRVAAGRDDLAQELTNTYPPAVKQLVDLFERISEFDKEIDRINDSAPAGEPSRLRGVELTARDMDYFTDVQPPLAKLLQLPRPEETSSLAFPPHVVNFAVQAAEMVARAMAGRAEAYGPNWHEIREAEIERRRADTAAVQTLAERTQERSKQVYLEDQQPAARGE